MQIPNRNSFDGLIIANSRGPSEFTLRRNNMKLFRHPLVFLFSLLLSSTAFCQNQAELNHKDLTGDRVLSA